MNMSQNKVLIFKIFAQWVPVSILSYLTHFKPLQPHMWIHRPIFPQTGHQTDTGWTQKYLVTGHFGLWTHELAESTCHMSHLVNLLLKWYSRWNWSTSQSMSNVISKFVVYMCSHLPQINCETGRHCCMFSMWHHWAGFEKTMQWKSIFMVVHHVSFAISL